jgi:cyclase
MTSRKIMIGNGGLFATVLCLLTSFGCGPRLVEIDKGVYACIGEEPAPNSGAIKTDFGSIIVDAQPGLKATKALAASVRKRLGWEVSYLIMTSHHADHSLGNEVFKKAEIISSAATRREFLSKTDKERKMLGRDLRLSGLLSAQLVGPSMTFEKTMTLYAGASPQKTVEIQMIEMPGGAAPGNLVVYLPKKQILFAGDLIVNKVFPYMGDADLGKWLKALDQLEKLKIKHLLPGHGKLGGRELIGQTREFLRLFVLGLKKAKAKGTLKKQRPLFSVEGCQKWPGARELSPIALEKFWNATLPEIKAQPVKTKPVSVKP